MVENGFEAFGTTPKRSERLRDPRGAAMSSTSGGGLLFHFAPRCNKVPFRNDSDEGMT